MPTVDRDALVRRNRAMTEAFHKLPPRHYLRRGLLRFLSVLPISKGKGRENNRILLIRPDHLGDVLLTIPAIHALRRARPGAEIHALVGPWSAAALANCPDVDRVITLAFPGFTRSESKGLRSPYQLALRSANQLRQIGYSSAVILRPDHWWGALVAFLAGIPQRIGYNQDDVKPFLTDTYRQQHEHAVLKNMRLLNHWTGHIDPDKLSYNFITTPQDHNDINHTLHEWGILPQQPIICIHPGAGTWVKRWEESHWAKVADTLASQFKAVTVFTGTDHELLTVQGIAGQMQRESCILAGQTSVGQLAALYKRALVVLGPDSGPLHLAAAVHTPTVALFGPADPVEFAPWGPEREHSILTSSIHCRPCGVLDWGGDNPDYHPCVREISMGRVIEATRRVIRQVV